MDVVQIDHTLVDVMVVDREHRRSIGRPWLTLAVDVASRAVIGFTVSLENPSALSVSRVLSHAVVPKTSWLADRELGVWGARTNRVISAVSLALSLSLILFQLVLYGF
jgi:putative transposase